MLLKDNNKINNFINKYRFEKTLKARVARGGFWLGIGSSSEQFLRFLRNIILVRVLIPEAFGTMAIILAVNMFFEAFTEVGIKEAIIQNP
jgi:O-antigen/teichoic acid export membrane protein